MLIMIKIFKIIVILIVIIRIRIIIIIIKLSRVEYSSNLVINICFSRVNSLEDYLYWPQTLFVAW